MLNALPHECDKELLHTCGGDGHFVAFCPEGATKDEVTLVCKAGKQWGVLTDRGSVAAYCGLSLDANADLNRTGPEKNIDACDVKEDES